jgi:plasmid stability protein
VASVLTKNLPDDLHQQLEVRARQHHRSLNKVLIALIQSVLQRGMPQDLPEPVRLRRPLTQDMLDHAREEGRA